MNTLTVSSPVSGWATFLDEVPDPVFAGRLMGDGVAIDPLDGTLVAPCAGTVASVHTARHAVTLHADNGAELLMHIGLDTVALAGEGFQALVAAGQRVATGDPLIRFDLDMLGRCVRSLVTPLLVVNGDEFRIETRAGVGPVSAGDALMTLVAVSGAEAPAIAMSYDTAIRDVVVPLAHGIHARPAARLAALARGYAAMVTIALGDREARLVSPTAVMALSIGHGDTVKLTAIGPDAAVAIDAVATLIAGGMDEAAAVSPPVRTTSAAPAVAAEPAPAGAIRGVTAAPGLAMGPAYRLRMTEITVSPTGTGLAEEQARSAAARQAVLARLQAAGEDDDAHAGIAAAHAAFLDDPALTEAVDALIEEGASAGHAWRHVCRDQAATLRAAADPRIAERADDLLDLERQLLRAITGTAEMSPTMPDGVILLADDLLPSQVTQLAGAAALATARGGPTSHVAIIAAGIGLPALVAIGPVLDAVAEDTLLVLDADAGTVEVDPAPARIAAVAAELARRTARDAAARGAAMQPARTVDGHRVAVMANLANATDAAEAVAEGAEGCGLLRTEFMFLDRATQPDEAEQTADYNAVACALEGRPLIVRLLDVGGDKPASYLPIAAEENPALGLRGIRVGLAHRDVLRTQLRAILRAGMPGQCRIMVPMVSGLHELRAVRAELDAARADIGMAAAVELGVMVETPAAAVMADRLAAEADFLSIGTNDLTQYTLAMDRGNPAVAAGIDGLDPAVLRLIRQTCDGAATYGRWAGVCGGLASDLLAVPILIGLGVTELSVTPALVGRVKALVRTIDHDRARDHAAAAMACATASEVRMLARTFDRGLAA